MKRARKAKAIDSMGELGTGSDVDIARCLRQALFSRHGKIVWSEGSLYHFDQTHWMPFEPDALRREAQKFDGMQNDHGTPVKLSKSRLDSILNELGTMAADHEYFQTASIGINCANGFISISDGGMPELLEHSPDYRARHVLSMSWHRETDWRSASLLNKLLNGCFREDQDIAPKIKLIGEVMGAAILGYSTKLRQARAFILHGATANNGKSQVIDCVRGLLPSSAVRSISPSWFDNQPMLASLAGALLNTTGELGSGKVISSEVFKSVVTGDEVTGRSVYKNPIRFRARALHLFATNTLPAFGEGIDRGVKRRLMIIPFNRSIPPDEMIPDLATRIGAEEGEALLAFAVEGACRLIRQGEYTAPPSCGLALSEWIRDADPVMAWFMERAEFAPGEKWPVKDIYADFIHWAKEEGYVEKSWPAVNNFVRRLLSTDPRLTRQKANALRSIVGMRPRAHAS